MGAHSKEYEEKIIVDALTSGDQTTWQYGNKLYLVGHLMNDPTFSDNPENLVANCVKPRLEVMTSENINTNTELLIEYNCN